MATLYYSLFTTLPVTQIPAFYQKLATVASMFTQIYEAKMC